MSSAFRNLLEDPLAGVRSAALRMLAERDAAYSLPAAFYNDERLFQLDLQEIFEKEWLFAGMTCEIPTKGSYFTLDVGDNPVVVVRGQDGAIHAFHNVCRHRGSRLCTRGSGKVAKLVCPYHQWTYELDGRLLFAGNDMGPDFDLHAFGLKPVHVRTAGGYIFVCLGERAPAVDEFLQALDRYLAPHHMDQVKVAAESSIIEEANWKLVIENNRECYHCSGSHPELLNSLMEFDDTDDPRATPAYRDMVARRQRQWDACDLPYELARFGKRNRMTRTPLLDGTVSMTMDGKPACGRRLGIAPGVDAGVLRILHLPNSWNHFMADHAVVFRVLPLGPQRTQVTTKWLVHKDAVEGVDYEVETLRKVWDATNDQDRRLAEENQRGVNSRAYEPGPYSPTFEFGVVEFVAWYAERMQANLAEHGGTLRVANAE